MQIVVSAAEGDELQPAFGSTVYGKVMCSGEGVPDVAVSDGFEVVRTDKDGVYQLPSVHESSAIHTLARTWSGCNLVSPLSKKRTWKSSG